jgi:hypothetical protein
MDFKAIEYEGMDWINLTQDKDQWRGLVSMVMNLLVASNAEDMLTSWVTVSFSRRTLLYGISYLS